MKFFFALLFALSAHAQSFTNIQLPSAVTANISNGTLFIAAGASVQSPIADFTIQTPWTGGPLSLITDGSFSFSPLHPPLTNFIWSFGDGTIISTDSRGADFIQAEKVEHLYASQGTYQISLTVADKSGATATKQQSFTFTQPGPVPNFTTIQWPGTHFVFFGGELSKDVLWYRYDFGDGTGSGWYAKDFAYKTYTNAGEYNVTLNVRDEQVRSNSITKTIIVK
jgi:PKD repeat protein